MSSFYAPHTIGDVPDAYNHEYPPTKPFRSTSVATEQSIATHAPEFVVPNAPNDLPYDRGRRSLVLFGLILTLVAGSAFIGIGIGIYARSHNTDKYIVIQLSQWTDVALGLSFSAIVTMCTEATGYVHGTTLKWGLAKEGRLKFNANLRLFSATNGALSVNGAVVNIASTLSLIFSYAASSTMLMHSSILPKFLMGQATAASSPSITVISFLPPIILGATLILQAILGLVAFSHTHVPTWSSSPLDITSALVHHGYVQCRPQRCMRPVSMTKDSHNDPIRPMPRQPSIWSTHKAAPRVVWFVSGTLVAWAGWICIVWFVPPPDALWFRTSEAPLGSLMLSLMYLAAAQSVVTIVLHCCELVTTLARDEVVWRAASKTQGARPAGNPLKVVLRSWKSAALLLAKPAIHWYFGINVSVTAGEGFQVLWIAEYFPIVLFLVAVFITIVATRRPSGPQPAAYGHVQTLADLVDEWSLTLYWGHKVDRVAGPWPVCHAGTTKSGPLPPIRMEEFYA
ncbi:hypothetical protein FRB94_010501 [Tulasnella sp. JGI-2019a]|nr:hypothetical protein FRB94_010501 [Tulasnella sp. JGI-2019a]KAG9033059.1 hypothetical protein FRB95_000645 [Tulasnella sp. JGI-2019a]